MQFASGGRASHVLLFSSHSLAGVELGFAFLMHSGLPFVDVCTGYQLSSCVLFFIFFKEALVLCIQSLSIFYKAALDANSLLLISLPFFLFTLIRYQQLTAQPKLRWSTPNLDKSSLPRIPGANKTHSQRPAAYFRKISTFFFFFFFPLFLLQ
jgi:hypothetical protein